MRRTQLVRWGIGTAAGLVTLGTVGGCGMGGGITVVGANPASYAGRTVTVVASTSVGGAPSAATAGETATTATVAGGASVAGAASTTSAATAAAPTTTATATATNTTVSACSTADLHLQVLEASQPTPLDHLGTTIPINPGLLARQTTRTEQLTLIFTNVSHSACTMHGYPSVDFLRAGVHGPLSAPDSFAQSPGITNVRLAPGETAESQISFTTNSAANSRGRRCDEVVAVRVYPPGSTKALTSGTRDSRNLRIPNFYVCGHAIVVRAVQPK